MAKRKSKAVKATDRINYTVEAEWTDADRALLARLQALEDALPPDAPRALLSVRLSVFTEDTTSPVRQELDLRQLAIDKGMRVVGVASDLNVSATKVQPWKRKELGAWLVDRVPEFDALLFWKIDRFVRNIGDLHTMIAWAERYGKNLISKHDPIDLETAVGKILVTLIGGMAEIEAANTATRVSSLWDYNKKQAEWLVGKPPYGYEVVRDPKTDFKSLGIYEPQAKVLRTIRERLLEGQALYKIAKDLKGEGIDDAGDNATIMRRLRSQALLGYRVEIDDSGGTGFRRSRPVLDNDGNPIVVGPPIFTREEWEEVQAELDKRSKNQPQRHAKGLTKFLGVLKCADCGTNMTVHKYTNNSGTYSYLKCRNCPKGGTSAPNPELVYDSLVETVLTAIGDLVVERREYARGAEMRRTLSDLEQRIAYYMEGLEPGGRYTKTQFTQQQANETLDKLIAELEAIDPSETEDRWVKVADGKTFREHWEEGGMDAMSADLLRAGITCVVERTKVPGQRAPHVHLKLRVPKDVRDRLLVRDDAFADEL